MCIEGRNPKSRAIRSPILWLGGKGTNWRWIVQHMHAHRTYVEPFGGGASVLLNKPASSVEVYNDLDKRLYSLFKVLRDPTKARKLNRLLKLTPYSEDEYHDAWDASPSTDEVEKARTVFAQLRMAFGGLGSRGHRPGFGFAKTSCRAKATKACVDHLPTTVERLRSVTIMNRCGIDVIRRFDSPETLFYCDPPYHSQTRKGTADYQHEMSDSQHLELLNTLKNVKGKVMLSGYDNPLYQKHLSGWRRSTRVQALQCSRDKTQKRTESLWMNW